MLIGYARVSYPGSNARPPDRRAQAGTIRDDLHKRDEPLARERAGNARL